MTSGFLLSPSLSHSLPYRAESVRSRGYAHPEPVPHQGHILGIRTHECAAQMAKSEFQGQHGSLPKFIHLSENRLSWACTSLVARSNQRAANWGCASSLVVMGESWHGKRTGVWPLPEIRSQKLLSTARLWCRTLRSPIILNLNLTFQANIEGY